MPQASILAKTSRPNLAGVLARERLFSLLDHRRRSSAVWINAGAGCGKTALAASYLNARRPVSQWYQLDVRDSDVATFFSYMSRGAGDGHRLDLPLFNSRYRNDVSAYARRYFRILFGAMTSPFVLVLDNYQVIPPRSALHVVVRNAIAEMPPEGCLMVLSRGEPPAPLARHRANREIEMLGWNDLRLTREESDSIIDQWDDTWGECAREQVYAKTQGWAAGLILMLDQTLSESRGSEAPERASQKPVFDYFVEEILQSFDAPTRNLLLKTAFLNEMTASMAAALASEPRAGEILARLHRHHHLLGARSGGGEPVYQRHPQLVEVLRARAEVEIGEGERRGLRRKARALLETAGAYEDLVTLLHGDRDWAELARVVLARAPHMIRVGRAETIEQWIDDLPEEQVAANGWFHYWRAVCRFHNAPQESRRLYERAFALFQASPSPDHDALLLTCSGAIEAIIYELDDFRHFDSWIEATTALLGEDAPRSVEVEARATVSLFLSLVFRQPSNPALDDWAERAYRHLYAIEDGNARITAQLLVTIVLNYTGQFSRAGQFIDRMRRACRSSRVPPPAVKMLRYVESTYYMLTADQESCLRVVYEGLEVGRAAGVRRWTGHILSNGVASALGAGNLKTATELLASMREHQEDARRLDFCTFHYCSAWLDMLRRNPVAAFQEVKTALGIALECGSPFWELLCRVAIAHVLTELGDDERALSHLLESRSLVRDARNRLLEFSELMVFAYVALKLGRRGQGIGALRRALEIGREHGYVHFLWWQPSPVSQLCTWALEEGIEVDYVRCLIRKRRLHPEGRARHSRRWPWRFEIRALGNFDLRRDGNIVGRQDRMQKKPMELLKGLVGFGAEQVPEAQLAASLWPRIAPDYARRSLTTTLHRLRKLVGEDRLISLRRGRLSIDTRLCWIDVCAFDAVTASIDEGLRSGSAGSDTVQVERWAEELFVLYRGSFMCDEVEYPHYLRLRARLRRKFRHSVGELAFYWEERAEWERAATCYERGIEADGLAEGLYRNLMLCYRRIGRVTRAIDTYDRLRSTLKAEHVAEPAPETTTIYRRMVEQL